MTTKNTSNLNITETFIYWFYGLMRVFALIFIIYALPRVQVANPWINLALTLGAICAIITFFYSLKNYFVKETDKGLTIKLWEINEVTT